MVTLSQMFSGYYILKIVVVIACSLIQTGVTLHMKMFSGYYICKIIDYAICIR